ncbi:MAG: hypothetical protein ACK458_04030 [Sphingobacteriales bacterium]|jgi:hypothetical protein
MTEFFQQAVRLISFQKLKLILRQHSAFLQEGYIDVIRLCIKRSDDLDVEGLLRMPSVRLSKIEMEVAFDFSRDTISCSEATEKMKNV